MKRKKTFRRRLRRLALQLVGLVLGWYLLCCLALAAYTQINPLITTVQIQRRLESFTSDADYQPRQSWIPLAQIPQHVRHAVIAAEDGSFYTHSGIDWAELNKVVQDVGEGGRLRGASTLSQQLVKNLFLTTHSALWRKALEYPLTPAAETLLSKDRILELYLNEVEWGPNGVWGIGAAAQFHYGIPAQKLTRAQAARLAACLPAPRSRRPQQMDNYSAIILERMTSRGW